MSTIKSFEDLNAWQQARCLNKEIYRISSRGTFGRDFALRDQIRRASISISSNIAEGFERNGRKEFLNFLSIAKASAGEVRSQLFLARDLEYIEEPEFNSIRELLLQTSKMIWGMMEYLRKSEVEGMKFKP